MLPDHRRRHYVQCLGYPVVDARDKPFILLSYIDRDEHYKLQVKAKNNCTVPAFRPRTNIWKNADIAQYVHENKSSLTCKFALEELPSEIKAAVLLLPRLRPPHFFKPHADVHGVMVTDTEPRESFSRIAVAAGSIISRFCDHAKNVHAEHQTAVAATSTDADSIIRDANDWYSVSSDV